VKKDPCLESTIPLDGDINIDTIAMTKTDDILAQMG
jgi:hypothetical protein